MATPSVAANRTETATTAETLAPIAVQCPANGKVVGQVPNLTAEQVGEIAQRLRTAQVGWEAIGARERAKYLLAWLDWYMDNEISILRTLQQESGKSWGDAAVETMVVVDVINYFAKNAASFLKDRSARPHALASATKQLKVSYRPYPLVGVISPWNYPVAMPIMDVAGALMAGAAVLSKPSEFTPLAWQAVIDGWKHIGAPAVLEYATGAGATGAAVVGQVDMVQFTGSTRTGRQIAVAAAERLIPVSLELGGKDAMIVLSDADIDRAVGGAVWGSMFNSGQSCVAVERAYVEAPVYDEFVAKLTAKVAELRQGMDPVGAYQADLGALANEAQVDIVAGHVDNAVAEGATVTTGGKRLPEGCFYAPTVLTDVTHNMACMREETFGPILPVMRVASEDEAIKLANDSPYGLAGSVWTKSQRRGQRVAKQLETGAVAINNAMVSVFQYPLPMGGWKESGLGLRFGGPAGVLKYCRPQARVSERIAPKSEIQWYPYTRRKARILERLVRLTGMHDWGRRLARRTDF
ncbi:aldehyde dehydrogenase family protein [Mycobacterium paraintracellulare]|uniref:aldehyde dehydrogenase family protein n=1 Tax=Mycobacterium paraintracellulare TaxID=1138383 RepID=UPI001925B2DD|nr:aldehyde dehydrogenase family protein [Mycobacterium paraintracellulare]BCP14195.1 aldehyde dehydrogenase [Mycobacterium paraintracellulare]